MNPTIIDLFAGGGGTSTGTVQSFQARGHEKITLTALNHDRYAIETHRINYPWASHYQQDIKKVNPTEVADPYELDLLVASPSCQGFSVARGGKVYYLKEMSFGDLDQFNVISGGFRNYDELISALKRAGYRFKKIEDYKAYIVRFIWTEKKEEKS